MTLLDHDNENLRLAVQVVEDTVSRYSRRSMYANSHHAPAGGIEIGGKRYPGGEFIPADVVAQASPEQQAALQEKPHPYDLGKAHLSVTKNDRNRILTQAGHTNLTQRIIQLFTDGTREALAAHNAKVKAREDERLAPYIAKLRDEYPAEDHDEEADGDYEDHLREMATRDADSDDEEAEQEAERKRVHDREDVIQAVTNEVVARSVDAVQKWAKANGWKVAREHGSSGNSYYMTLSRNDGIDIMTVRVSDHYAPHGAGFNENTQMYHDEPDVNIVPKFPEFDENAEYDNFNVEKDVDWSDWSVPLRKLDAKHEELTDEPDDAAKYSRHVHPHVVVLQNSLGERLTQRLGVKDRIVNPLDVRDDLAQRGTNLNAAESGLVFGNQLADKSRFSRVDNEYLGIGNAGRVVDQPFGKFAHDVALSSGPAYASSGPDATSPLSEALARCGSARTC